jgi:hypothetical protein
MDGTEAQINFDAPAVLRKWPSLQNQRRIDDFSPYLLLQSTLDECLRVLMKPSGTLHLYEIHTAPQLPLVIEGVLSGEHVAELARLRDFL